MQKNDAILRDDPETLGRDSNNDSKEVEADILPSLAQSDVDDFPDGGLKAIIVLCGVCGRIIHGHRLFLTPLVSQTVIGFFATYALLYRKSK